MTSVMLTVSAPLLGAGIVGSVLAYVVVPLLGAFAYCVARRARRRR